MIQQRQYPANKVQIEPSYRLIHNQADKSFVFRWGPFDLAHRWHYHPELEIIFFEEGSTSSIIGQEFMEFPSGTTLLFGSNLPHVLQENTRWANENPGIIPYGLVLQFREDFLGDQFFQSPEMLRVRKMLDISRRGISFSSATCAKARTIIKEMPELTDERKLLSLLNLLLTLSADEQYQLITKEGTNQDDAWDEEKMMRINEFLYKSFTEKVTLTEAARLVNMTESAFCRYFKARTLKNFTRYLNEIRISYACRLLHNCDFSVTDACYRSGFNSLSYFDRQFKAIMKISPKTYQQQNKIRIGV